MSLRLARKHENKAPDFGPPRRGPLDHTFEATLLSSGEVEFQGQRYASPSDAGGAAKATIAGKKMATNGWDFWQLDGYDGSLRELTHARSQFVAQQDAGKAKTNA